MCNSIRVHASTEQFNHQLNRSIHLFCFYFPFARPFASFTVVCCPIAIIINFHFSQIINRGSCASVFVCVPPVEKCIYWPDDRQSRLAFAHKNRIRSRTANGNLHACQLSLGSQHPISIQQHTAHRHRIRQASHSSSSETVHENCLMEQKIGYFYSSRPFFSSISHIFLASAILLSRWNKMWKRKPFINRRQSQRRDTLFRTSSVRWMVRSNRNKRAR